MTKIVLENIVAPQNLQDINSNFDKIEEALNDKVLWRNNPSGEANHMIQTNIDMNSNDLFNVKDMTVLGVFSAGGIHLTEEIERIGQISKEVQAAQVEISKEAVNAAASASNAATSATKSTESKTASETAAANAANQVALASNQVALAKTEADRAAEAAIKALSILPEAGNAGDILQLNSSKNPVWTVLASATTALAGLVQLATSSETITGTDTTKAITPSGLAALTSTTSRNGLTRIATSAQVIDGTQGAPYAISPAQVEDIIRSTIIYPNNGTAANPANVTINQRIVMTNPYPGYYVHCEAQLLAGGSWGEAPFTYLSGGYGTNAAQLLPSDNIIVQTGSLYVLSSGNASGTPLGATFSAITSAPCRVIVTRLGKIT